MRIEELAYLASLGAHRGFARCTTTEMAEDLGISQQGASRRLSAMEKEGLVERIRGKVKLTGKGIGELLSAYARLKRCFGDSIELEGEIVEGVGEAAHYLSMKEYSEQIGEAAGYRPYPGTVNIKITKGYGREVVAALAEAEIDGFKKKGRTYGRALLKRARLNGIGGHIIMPERTHYPNEIIEMIFPKKIKIKTKKASVEVPL